MCADFRQVRTPSTSMKRAGCDPATKFSSAGGHYALGKKHGYKTEGGPHAGDMPNQFVGQDGVLRAEVFDPYVTLGSGAGTLFSPTALRSSSMLAPMTT